MGVPASGGGDPVVVTTAPGGGPAGCGAVAGGGAAPATGAIGWTGCVPAGGGGGAPTPSTGAGWLGGLCVVAMAASSFSMRSFDSAAYFEVGYSLTMFL